MTIYNSINNGVILDNTCLFVGLGAGNSAFTPVSNNCTFVGSQAGHLFSSSLDCTAVGFTSSYSLTTGSRCTSLGSKALAFNVNGDDNTASGYGALNSCTGSYNTAFGSNAGALLVNGYHNIYLGRNAGLNHTGPESHNIIIGEVAGILGDTNKIRIGSTGTGAGQQNDTYIAGITTNTVSSLTSEQITLVDTNSNIKCISKADFMVDTAPKVTVYSTPGSYTWTKDPSTKYVTVYGWCGGCGGASGRKDVDGSNFGGGGGGAGSAFVVSGPSLIFDTTETVTVGAGGAGGAAQTVDSTDGNAGSVGGATSFGNVRPFRIETAGGGNGTGGNNGSFNAQNGALYDYGPAGNGDYNSGFPGSDMVATTGCYPMGTGGGGGAGNNNIANNGGRGGEIQAFNGTVILSGGTGGGITQSGTTGLPYLSQGGLMEE